MTTERVEQICKRADQISYVTFVIALITHLIMIIVFSVRGNITQAPQISAIFMLIDGTSPFEILFELIILAAFVWTVCEVFIRILYRKIQNYLT